MKKIFTCLSVIGLLLTTGCSSDETGGKDGDNGGFIITSDDEKCDIDTKGTNASINFGGAGGVVTVTIKTSEIWTYDKESDSNADWCKITRDDDKLTFSVGTYVETGSIRKCSVKLSNQGKIRGSIEVTQTGDANAATLMSSDYGIIHGTGGEWTLEISSTLDEWYIDTDNYNWLSVRHDGDLAVFSASANSTDEKRVADLELVVGPEYNREILPLTVVQPTDKAMILQYTLTKDIREVYLPFIKEMELSVDWGDGTVETFTDMVGQEHYGPEDFNNLLDEYIVHAYNEPGVYKVSITGQAYGMYGGPIEQVNLMTLTAIERFGDLGLIDMERAFVWSSVKTLPADRDAGFKNVVNFDHAFSSSQELRTMEEGVFEYAHNCTSFYQTFAYSHKLHTLPPNMFKGLRGNGDFYATFFQCFGLETIGEGFAQNCHAHRFYLTFFTCPLLKNVPSGMFSGSVCKMFDSVFQTTGLETVPEGLFADCAYATHMSNLFFNCSSLKKIEGPLFEGCTKLETFDYNFYYCSALVDIPEDLFKGLQIKESRSMFINTGLKTIPGKLLSYLPQAEKIEDWFSYCSNLEEIPSDLFQYNTKLTNVSSMFRHCKKLKTIPGGLFKDNWTLTDVSCNFLASGIETVPADLFEECINLTSVRELFKNCENLTSVPTTIFDYSKKIVNFSETFSGCTSLTGKSPYTNVGGMDIHLYQRAGITGYSAPTSYTGCFNGCSGLEDYADIQANYPDWL